MRRFVLLSVGVIIVLFGLTACHEFSDDTTTTASGECRTDDQTVADNQTADLGCVKVTFTKSQYAASQLDISVRVENTSDQPLNIKQSLFDAQDSGKTSGLPTTCTETGGKGGFSGQLQPGDKAEADLCWFLVGATPPVKVMFGVTGSGKVTYTVNTQ
jgi:hypothetical protein